MRKKGVILAGPLPRPRKVFDKARLDARHGGMVRIAEDLTSAIALARQIQRCASECWRASRASLDHLVILSEAHPH